MSVSLLFVHRPSWEISKSWGSTQEVVDSRLTPNRFCVVVPLGVAVDEREGNMRQQVVAAASVSGDVRCTECGELASGLATGWKAYLAGGFEDVPVEVIVFCPACAFRELGTAA